MASSTETRSNNDTRERDRDRDRDYDIIDTDRRLLQGWDRQEAWGEWFDAALTLHRDYLDLFTKSLRMMVPYRTN